MGPIYTLADFLDMLRRRVGLITAFVIAGCFASVFYALSTPHMYTSSEVIQVERPTISDELARSTVESSAARRLQLIEQQLMARGNLLALMDELGLYQDLAGLTLTEKVALMRESISITGVAAVREGFADDGAISVLTITAQMDSAERAQAVAHTLADQTRVLAAQQRDEQTRETLEFFQQQEAAVLEEIAQTEAALLDFRTENDLSIEGSLEFRRSELGSLNDALLELDREIIAAELELENIDRGGSTRAATIERETEALNRQIDSLKIQRQLLMERRTALSASIETTPEVERGLSEFERRLEQLQDQLTVITTRRNEAEVAFSLEAGARGEQFVTLEEAPLPEYPYTTSRKILVLAGVFASAVLGTGIAFLLELRRPVMRTAQQMERETGLLPVVSIPNTSIPPRKRKGLAKFWQDRRASGQRGRAARLARHSSEKTG